MNAKTQKTIHIHYVASLREQRKQSEETMQTDADTPAALYSRLRRAHRLSLAPEDLRVAVNDSLASFDKSLNDGDSITFLPPVAGG